MTENQPGARDSVIQVGAPNQFFAFFSKSVSASVSSILLGSATCDYFMWKFRLCHCEKQRVFFFQENNLTRQRDRPSPSTTDDRTPSTTPQASPKRPHANYRPSRLPPVPAQAARGSPATGRPRATATSVAIARCTATESFCAENAVHERAAHVVWSCSRCVSLFMCSCASRSNSHTSSDENPPKVEGLDEHGERLAPVLLRALVVALHVCDVPSLRPSARLA